MGTPRESIDQVQYVDSEVPAVLGSIGGGNRPTVILPLGDGLTIEDGRLKSSGPVIYVAEITAAEMAGLDVTRKRLVPAHGVGKTAIAISMTLLGDDEGGFMPDDLQGAIAFYERGLTEQGNASAFGITNEKFQGSSNTSVFDNLCSNTYYGPSLAVPGLYAGDYNLASGPGHHLREARNYDTSSGSVWRNSAIVLGAASSPPTVSGGIAESTVSTPGAGFAPGQKFIVDGVLDRGKVGTTTVAAAGTGYAVGDFFELQDQSPYIRFKVDSVDENGGVVTYHRHEGYGPGSGWSLGVVNATPVPAAVGGSTTGVDLQLRIESLGYGPAVGVIDTVDESGAILAWHLLDNKGGYFVAAGVNLIPIGAIVESSIDDGSSGWAAGNTFRVAGTDVVGVVDTVTEEGAIATHHFTNAGTNASAASSVEVIGVGTAQITIASVSGSPVGEAASNAQIDITALDYSANLATIKVVTAIVVA